MDKIGKIHEVNVQDVKIMYLVDELMKCLPDDEALGCAGKYCAHPKSLEVLFLSLNPNVFPDFETTIQGLPFQQLLLIKLLIIFQIKLPSHKVYAQEQIDPYIYLKVVQTPPIPTNSAHGKPLSPINNQCKSTPLKY